MFAELSVFHLSSAKLHNKRSAAEIARGARQREAIGEAETESVIFPEVQNVHLHDGVKMFFFLGVHLHMVMHFDTDNIVDTLEMGTTW